MSSDFGDQSTLTCESSPLNHRRSCQCGSPAKQDGRDGSSTLAREHDALLRSASFCLIAFSLALHIAIGQSAPEVDDFSALVRLPPSEPRWLPSGAIAGVIRPQCRSKRRHDAVCPISTAIRHARAASSGAISPRATRAWAAERLSRRVSRPLPARKATSALASTRSKSQAHTSDRQPGSMRVKTPSRRSRA
jgi:hypothetical protein